MPGTHGAPLPCIRGDFFPYDASDPVKSTPRRSDFPCTEEMVIPVPLRSLPVIRQIMVGEPVG